ncbi:MAG: hypothetical protein ACRBDI_02935 [Alphaproteobacteria bacterium]
MFVKSADTFIRKETNSTINRSVINHALRHDFDKADSHATDKLDQTFQNALDKTPFDADLLYHYSSFLFKQGRFQDAYDQWDKTFDAELDIETEKDLHFIYTIALFEGYKKFPLAIDKSIVQQQAESAYRLDLSNDYKIALNEMNSALNMRRAATHPSV